MKIFALVLVLVTLALSQDQICPDCAPCEGDYYRDRPATVEESCCTPCSSKTCRETQLDARCSDPKCDTTTERVVRDFYGCCSSCEKLPEQDPCVDAQCDQIPDNCIKSAVPAGECCERCYEYKYDPCADVQCLTTIDKCDNGDVIKADPAAGVCCDSCPTDPTTDPCANYRCPEVTCPNNVKPVRYEGSCCQTCPDPCATVLCAEPRCDNPVKKEGECCPTCPCSTDIKCPPLDCTGNIYTPAGACCPVCEETDPCADVKCADDDICSIYDRTINYREEDKCCPPRIMIDCYVPECYDSNKQRVEPVRVEGECCPRCPDQDPCRLTLCPAVALCPDGTKPVTPAGECCPRCRDETYCNDRDLAACETKEVDCLTGQVEVTDDRCCPRCVRDCRDVKCETKCPEGQVPAPVSTTDRQTAECCPPYQCIDEINKCDEVSCERIQCEGDKRPFFTTEDPCCPVCDVASDTICANVKCAEPVCPEGYSTVIPPRECCKTCQKDVRVEYYLSAAEFDPDEFVRYIISRFADKGIDLSAEDFIVRVSRNSDGKIGISVEFNNDSNRDIADRIMLESNTYDSVTVERFGDEDSTSMSSTTVIALILTVVTLLA